jgi:large subunit ribosomal protein L10
MALTKDQKQEQVAAIAEQLEGHHTVYLTDYAGLTVEEATRLRRAFRAADVEFKVYKNTLLRRAMEARGGFDELFDQLNGPTAVAFTNDPASPARVLKKYLEGMGDKRLPKFKGAYVDGAVFGEGQLDALSTLKSKDELIADVLGLLMAPITNVASALGAPGRKLAGVVKVLAEREA